MDEMDLRRMLADAEAARDYWFERFEEKNVVIRELNDILHRAGAGDVTSWRAAMLAKEASFMNKQKG